MSLIDRFADENFIVWFDRGSHSVPVLHIILKEGHSVQDHLQAWVLATEIASRCCSDPPKPDSNTSAILGVIRPGSAPLHDLEKILDDAQAATRDLFPAFLAEIPKAGWDLAAAAGGFVTGLPTTLYVEPEEDRKSK